MAFEKLKIVTFFVPPLPQGSLSSGGRDLMETSHLGLGVLGLYPSAYYLGFLICSRLLQEEASLRWLSKALIYKYTRMPLGVVICFIDPDHSDWYKMKPQSSFNLYFLDDKQMWEKFWCVTLWTISHYLRISLAGCPSGCSWSNKLPFSDLPMDKSK